NGALTISPAGVGDLSPVITGPNGEVAQNGATTTDLTGPSGIAPPGAASGPETQQGDLELCFESQDGVCVVGP
ncbi:MAG: hypothetical protein AB7P07_06905, partial [Hyphomonadaceae bacterium]